MILIAGEIAIHLSLYSQDYYYEFFFGDSECTNGISKLTNEFILYFYCPGGPAFLCDFIKQSEADLLRSFLFQPFNSLLKLSLQYMMAEAKFTCLTHGLIEKQARVLIYSKYCIPYR